MNNKVIITHLESAGITFVAFFLMELATVIKDWNAEMLSWSLIIAAIVSAARVAVKMLYTEAVKPMVLRYLQRTKDEI